MKDAALKYLTFGWSLIPLKPQSKTPLISWQEFQKRRATEAEVREWLLKWPSMNLGCVTGSISGFCVIDLDGPEGLNSGRNLGLKSSVVSLTGNGRQLWYKNQDGIGNSVKLLAPGVDVRGEGGYVCLPPSVHPNGRQYRWLNVLSASSVTQLPPFPMQFIVKDVPKNGLDAKGNGGAANPKGWIAEALENMTNGNIDNTLFKVCSRLRNDGFTETDAITLLRPHAERAGASDGHLEDKIRNVWGRYEAGKRNDKQSGALLGNSNGSRGYAEPLRLTLHSPSNPDSLDEYRKHQMGSEAGERISTGFNTLDQYFEGGLKSERPFVIAARTGTGKTNFGVALSYNLCQRSKKVVYFSTEFKYTKIWKWYLAYCKDIEEFKKHKFNVCDEFNPNIDQIEKVLIEYKPDVFIFDYIQHMGKEKEKLEAFMHGAQFLQKKYDSQAVILAQLNRNADFIDNGKRVDPRMSMIEGSASIEQTSSRVLLLSSTHDDLEKREITGILDKNDQGDTGIINFVLTKRPYIFKEAL